MSNHTVAIVQARVGSSRLPGKVLAKINGHPLIHYLLVRLSQSKLIDEIVVATSTNPENDELCQVVTTLGYAVFRGDEDDVLQRINQAAVKFDAQHIVRITGDSPLLDAKICDQLINYYFVKQVDYAYLSADFCEGVDCEVISAVALMLSAKQAKKMSEREHVTLFAYNHPELFTMTQLKNSQDDSSYRFTVDSGEDLKLVTQVISAHLKHENNSNIEQINSLSTEKIKVFLDNNPQIKAQNSKIVRNQGLAKSLAEDFDIN